MPLFAGVENFTPALEGQRIAIGAGQGAGQSISRGAGVAQRGKEFEFYKQQTQRKNLQEDSDNQQSMDMADELTDMQRQSNSLYQFGRELRDFLNRQRSGQIP